MCSRGGGRIVAGGAAHLCVGGAAEFALVIQVQQFTALVAVEEQAFGVEELERVVFRRIVRGGDGDAAARAGGAHVDLDGRGGQYADIHYFAAGREQAAGDGMVQHLAARPGVAADDHAARTHVGAESLGEGAGQAGCEEIADHAADAGYADFQEVFAGRRASLAGAGGWGLGAGD